MDAHWIVGAVAIVSSVLALDRVLLWVESRGWMNYRRHGLSRGAALYHMLELQAIFDPGIQQVIEAEYRERKEQDESGAPPAGPS
jgi:hypothetical protein